MLKSGVRGECSWCDRLVTWESEAYVVVEDCIVLVCRTCKETMENVADENTY